jgi:hypothetical protein
MDLGELRLVKQNEAIHAVSNEENIFITKAVD